MASSNRLSNTLGSHNDFRNYFRELYLILFVFYIISKYFSDIQLPESPRWLVKHGRHAEALAVISALDDKDITDPEVQRTYLGIHETVVAEGEIGTKPTSLGELFTHGRSQNFRRAALAITAQCFQQITGINLITYYAVGVSLLPMHNKLIYGPTI